jgi:hypothetical protein
MVAYRAEKAAKLRIGHALILLDFARCRVLG